MVTSPPYWGLRDYGAAGQIGLEPNPQDYLSQLVKIFDIVRDLLADDGSLWLNMGDTLVSSFREKNSRLPKNNILGLPWRLAFALQDANWFLRSDIIWCKPNPMPESVKNRPTRAHEYIFLLTKKNKYYYNFEAAREPSIYRNNYESRSTFARRVVEPVRPGNDYPQHRPDRVRKFHTVRPGIDVKGGNQGSGYIEFSRGDRNWRDVWTIPPQSTSNGHFATFPEDLVRRCLIAGSRPGDLVLDPFMGSGTVAVVSEKLGRKWLGIELNPNYIEIQNGRLAMVAPLLRSAGI